MIILLVDDNESDLELISRYCLPYEVRCASDRDSLAIVLRDLSQFDIAIVDYALPNMPWPEALQLIRAKNPSMPILVSSGAMSDDMGIKALRAGADDYMKKDVMSEELVPRLQRILRLHEALRKNRDTAGSVRLSRR